MVAVPGPPSFSELVWEVRLDCRARQFAEAGGDEFKAGHDRELLLRRTIRGDKFGGENTRPERASFGREWRCLARTRRATKRCEEYTGRVHRLTPNPQARTRLAGPPRLAGSGETASPLTRVSGTSLDQPHATS